MYATLQHTINALLSFLHAQRSRNLCTAIFLIASNICVCVCVFDCKQVFRPEAWETQGNLPTFILQTEPTPSRNAATSPEFRLTKKTETTAPKQARRHCNTSQVKPLSTLPPLYLLLLLLPQETQRNPSGWECGMAAYTGQLTACILSDVIWRVIFHGVAVTRPISCFCSRPGQLKCHPCEMTEGRREWLSLLRRPQIVFEQGRGPQSAGASPQSPTRPPPHNNTREAL